MVTTGMACATALYMSRLIAALSLALLLACGSKPAGTPEVAAQKPIPPAPAAQPELQAGVQPKPGQRVRQPLLDEHCNESSSPVAFYYHGGRPFAQRALNDGCRPLYFVECSENGLCTESREQEAGVWCCVDPTQRAAHAERR